MSLITTIVQNMAAVATPVDELEKRKLLVNTGLVGGVINVTNQDGTIVTASVKEKVAQSWGTDAKILSFKGTTATVETTRVFTQTDDAGVSTKVAIVMGYIGTGFKVYKQMFLNSNGGQLNEITEETYVAEQMRIHMDALKLNLMGAIETTLQANKSAVAKNVLNYEIINGVVNATYAQGPDVVGDASRLVKGNDFNQVDPFTVIHDTGIDMFVSRIKENGASQAVNLLNRLGDKEFFYDTHMQATAGDIGKMYIVPSGSIGLVTRIAPLAVIEHHSSKWKFSKFNGSAWGLPFELEMIEGEDGADTSAQTGNAKDTRDIATTVKFGFDYALVVPIAPVDTDLPKKILEIRVNSQATDADVTAPTASIADVTALTNVTAVFTEAMCSDAAGTLLVPGSDIKAKFTLSAGTITSAIVSSDSTEVVFIISGSSNTATLKNNVALYDGNGNAFAVNTTIATATGGVWV